jgi:outer membrane autotransporter protein
MGVKVRNVYGAVTPEVRARWIHEFLDSDYTVDASFGGYPASAFAVRTDQTSRDRAAAGFGIQWEARENLGVSLGYDAVLSSDWTYQTAYLNLLYRW